LRRLPDLKLSPVREYVQELNASNNKLTEVEEQDMALLPNLTILNLAYNALQTIPQMHTSCWFLSTLDLRKNKLCSLPEHLCALPELTVLNVAGNCLVQLPKSIGKCRNLRTLDVSDNELVALPTELSDLSLDPGGLDWSLNPQMCFPPAEARGSQRGIMEWLRKQAAMPSPGERHQAQALNTATGSWVATFKACPFNTQEEYEEVLSRKPHWMDVDRAMRIMEQQRIGGGWWPDEWYTPTGLCEPPVTTTQDVPTVIAQKISSLPLPHNVMHHARPVCPPYDYTKRTPSMEVANRSGKSRQAARNELNRVGGDIKTAIANLLRADLSRVSMEHSAGITTSQV